MAHVFTPSPENFQNNGHSAPCLYTADNGVRGVGHVQRSFVFPEAPLGSPQVVDLVFEPSVPQLTNWDFSISCGGPYVTRLMQFY